MKPWHPYLWGRFLTVMHRYILQYAAVINDDNDDDNERTPLQLVHSVEQMTKVGQLVLFTVELYQKLKEVYKTTRMEELILIFGFLSK